jgi:hypothetical protein
MQPAEIWYRAQQMVAVQIDRWRSTDPLKADPVAISGRVPEVPSQGFHVSRYASAADRIIAGRFTILGLGDACTGFPPQWNRDPKTGIHAPLSFGKTLKYHDQRLVGDIVYLWRLNRHQELVTLAQAWHLTGDEKYSNSCRNLLESWFDQCPYGRGPNWTSSLEHGVRLTNWAYAWSLLGGEAAPVFRCSDGGRFRLRWLSVIYQHCRFISSQLSRYSSANNHLLGEYMGLFVGGTIWPMWSESAHWRDLGKSGLEKEARIQNGTDGVNLEQALWYHHEVADMLLLCGLIGRANGVTFSNEYWQRIEAMLEFIASVMDAGGHVPMIGDSDDAVVVGLVPSAAERHETAAANPAQASVITDQAASIAVGSEATVFGSLLATGAVLFSRSDFKKKARHFDDKSRWLLGDSGAAQFHALPAATQPVPARRSFPDGGYWILGDAFETPGEVRIVADAGPLGYLSIAAHGHADALAFTLSVGGTEFLIDPGTYSYHTDEKWRDYFRGTSAHNTVRIDGIDQSRIGGSFMWIRHASARCLQYATNDDEDLWLAEHDGYLRLTDPVLHRRRLQYRKPERVLVVTDELVGKARHAYELHWHFSEGCEVKVSGNDAWVRCERTEIRITTSCGSHPEVIRGSDTPPLGWISRRFGQKQPTPCLRWRGEMGSDATLTTRFEIRTPA